MNFVLFIESGDKRKDVGHVLDFLTRLRKLHIEGSHETYLDSNIVLNKLPFELTHFRGLTHLKVQLH